MVVMMPARTDAPMIELARALRLFLADGDEDTERRTQDVVEAAIAVVAGDGDALSVLFE